MFHHQKFEPENKVLHGAGQSYESFIEYSSFLKNLRPILYMSYVKLSETKKVRKIFQEYSSVKDIFLQLGLSLEERDKGSIIPEILNGKYDGELLLLINFFKKINKPAFLRIGYEFNKNGRYNPKNFVQVWKYIVNFFRSCQCSNVAFVWCACTSFSKKIDKIMNYYPGGDYVDWFGEDIFNIKRVTEKDSLVKKFLQKSIEYKKPLMICESTSKGVGVEGGKESWSIWYGPFFKFIAENKNIKAFCYINWDWKNDCDVPIWQNWGDCRIQNNDFVAKEYFNELSKKRYIHRKHITALQKISTFNQPMNKSKINETKIILHNQDSIEIYRIYKRMIMSKFPKLKIWLIGSAAVPMKGKREIDILIETDNVEKCKNALKKIGFSKGPTIDCVGYLRDYRFHLQGEFHVVGKKSKKTKEYLNFVDNLKKNKKLKNNLEKCKEKYSGHLRKLYRKKRDILLKNKIAYLHRSR
jgi:GrpB-like predicted nucleotidyltransferase (UPF0157 family)